MLKYTLVEYSKKKKEALNTIIKIFLQQKKGAIKNICGRFGNNNFLELLTSY